MCAVRIIIMSIVQCFCLWSNVNKRRLLMMYKKAIEKEASSDIIISLSARRGVYRDFLLWANIISRVFGRFSEKNLCREDLIMIELSGINKTFRVAKRNAGFKEAVKPFSKGITPKSEPLTT